MPSGLFAANFEPETSSVDEVRRYLPSSFTKHIEDKYYGRVGEQSQLENAIYSDEFMSNPISHVALYSDHSIVHVRDVAVTILEVLDQINGLLIPKRDAMRFDFMKGYGVLLAYCHDIGMSDFSMFGRFMHTDFVVHEVFSRAYDRLVEEAWEGNYGNVPWRLMNLEQQGLLQEAGQTVFRELLAMSACHSAKTPIEELADHATLRQTMLKGLTTDLRYLFHQQMIARQQKAVDTAKTTGDEGKITAAEAKLAEVKQAFEAYRNEADFSETNLTANAYYNDLEANAFSWLTSDHPELRDLSADITDAVRALRAADALRKRGTELRTSGGYQIFTNYLTAEAVFALTEETGETYLFEATNPINAGEANVASSEITPDGNLRVSFYRGSFATEEVTKKAAYNVAYIIYMIQQGINETFQPSLDADASAGKKQTISILVEHTPDNKNFAPLVVEQLRTISEELADLSRVVPHLRGIAKFERVRYLHAPDINWTEAQKKSTVEKVGKAGYKVSQINVEKAFMDVRLIELRAGEIVMEARSPHAFVYIPMGEGVVGYPVGGYEPFRVKAWTPVGTFSVIRGAPRASTLVVQKTIDLLVIPEEVYLDHWHSTYSQEELLEQLNRIKQRQ